jgi:non-specific serine/threonine protein kinase
MERMVAALEKQLEIVPEDVRARILLAGQYAEIDRGEDAIRQLQTAVALRPGDSNVLYNAACVYCLLGRKADGLATLKLAFQAGYGNMEWAMRDPDLVPIHDEPEFQELCRRT